MKHYIDTKGNIYAYELDGSQDHLIGDKVAMTAEEIEVHINPPKTAEQLAQEASILRDQAMLTGIDYQGSMISLTKDDGDGMLQVEASFNRIQDAIAKGLLPINTEVKTKIHFKNGTELLMTAADFPSFALWFVLERGKFFV